MMDIRVRRAEKRDIPRIIDLLVQVCNVHHNGRPDIFKGDRTKYTPAQLEIIIDDETRPIFVGEDERGYVCGYGMCMITETRDHNVLCDRKMLYIDDLCVDEKMRGRGAGKAIYYAIMDHARQEGCYHVTLNVWACNPSAMAFYEAMGLRVLKKEMEVIL